MIIMSKRIYIRKPTQLRRSKSTLPYIPNECVTNSNGALTKKLQNYESDSCYGARAPRDDEFDLILTKSDAKG